MNNMEMAIKNCPECKKGTRFYDSTTKTIICKNCGFKKAIV